MMDIFTENWTHATWSPGRLGDRDVHSDRHKMLIVSAQKERPRDELPRRLTTSDVFSELIADKEAHGQIPFMDLMLRVRRFGLYGEDPDNRIVLVDGLPFDAWQIWSVCVALLGCADSVSWHLKRCEVGGELHLWGADWKAIIKGLTVGDGVQVLP